jgi:hypothetical protein
VNGAIIARFHHPSLGGGDMSNLTSSAARAACLPLLAAAILGSSAVARGADLYVSGAGTDGFDGATPLTPKKTIQAALAAATPPCTIKVALGEYLGSFEAGTHVLLRDGVSLSGGWSADFTAQDPAAHLTTIRDTSTAGGTTDLPNAAVVAGSGVTNATIVEGFEIRGGGGAYAAAIATAGNAAPVIRGNVLLGGALSSGSSIGAQLASPARVVGNRIRGQSGDYAMGVRIVGASPLVVSNVIEGGDGFTTWGVNAFGAAAPVIVGNTIRGGSGTDASIAVHVGLSATATIESNIVFAPSTAPVRVCVYKDGDAGSLASLSNNLLFDCPSALVARYAGLSAPFDPSADRFSSLAEINDATTLGVTTAGGNVSVDPAFADAATGDYHLTSTSPASVTQGGLGRSATFSVDADGAARTAPWSIGAYELDSAPGTGSGDPAAGDPPAPPKEDVLACGAASPGSAWWLGLPALLLALRSGRGRRGAPAATVALLAAAGVARAAPSERVVVLPLKAGAAVSEPVAEAVSDAFVAAIQARSGVAVLGARDLEAALSFEKRKQMLGCSEEMSCLAEIGGALGAGRIAYGSVARVGETLTFSAQLLDVKRAEVLGRFHLKLPGAGEQELLDAAEQAASELFPGDGSRASAAGTRQPGVAASARSASGVGRLYGLLAGASSTRSAGGLLGAGVGYRFGPHLAAELRALYTGGGWYGAGARMTAAIGPWRVRPYVALEGAFLSSDEGALAVGGEVGVEYRMSDRVRLAAGVPILFLPGAPARTEAAYLLLGGSASVGF